jgi:hypothetical protein
MPDVEPLKVALVLNGALGDPGFLTALRRDYLLRKKSMELKARFLRPDLIA